MLKVFLEILFGLLGFIAIVIIYFAVIFYFLKTLAYYVSYGWNKGKRDAIDKYK